MSSFSKIFSQPFPVLWRTALVRLPRAVPLSVLKWTSPEGPHPFVFQLPSRDAASYKIPLYIFIPPSLYASDATSEKGLPVLVDFHGGGFYLGSCMEQAPFCSQLARELNCVVMSVDYRMAPLNGFPAAIEDGEDVLRAILDEDAPGYAELRDVMAARIEKGRAEWRRNEAAARQKEQYKELRNGVIEQESVPNAATSNAIPSFRFDKSRVAISGFSSGGNLALNLALHLQPPELDHEWPSVFARDHSAPIPVLLFYPSFDLRQLPSERSRPASMAASTGFFSQLSDMLAPTYVPRENTGHPRASPGLASIDALHPSAKIFLVLAELDSLSEQSRTWVEKVNNHDRVDDVVVEEVAGVKHGWTQMPDGWLSDEEKKLKDLMYTKARAFIHWAWHESAAPEVKPGTANTA